MMWWYGTGTGGGYVLLAVGTLVFWGLAVLAAVATVRYLGGRDRARAGSPEEVLATRFAQGELDETEYRNRLETLHGTPGR